MGAMLKLDAMSLDNAPRSLSVSEMWFSIGF